MKMNRVKLQLGLALGATLLCLPVALSAHEPEAKAKPEVKTTKTTQKISADSASEYLKEWDSRITAAFGNLRYPAHTLGLSFGAGSLGARYSTTSTDDVAKVWAYYVDQFPVVDSKKGPNSKYASWTAPHGSITFESIDATTKIYTSFRYEGHRTYGTIVSRHENGETIFVTIAPIATAGKGSSKAKTTIEVMKLPPLSKTANGVVETSATQ